MIIQLLAGMFIGTVVACLVWGLVLKAGKSKADAIRREREEIMRSLGVLWVHIDTLLSTHRNSNFASKGFRESFTTKIDEINRLFKPNIHKFDVYYVKYTENLIAHYNRMVLKGEALVDVIAASADVELETNYSVVEQVVAAKPTISATVAATVKTASTTAHGESPAVDVDLSFNNVEKTIEAASQIKPVPSKELPKSDTENAKVSSSQIAEVPKIVGLKKAAVPDAPDTDLFEITTVGDMSAAIPVVGKETALPNILIPENKQEPEESFDFNGLKAPEQEFVMEVAMEKAPETIPLTRKAPPSTDEDMVAFEQTVELSAKEAEEKKNSHSNPFGDEDFTMETLVDVDLGSISSYLKKEGAAKVVPPSKTEEHDLFDVSSAKTKLEEDAANLEIVIASNVSHTDVVDKKVVSTPVDRSMKKGAPTAVDKNADTRGSTEKKGDATAAAGDEVDFDTFFEKAPLQAAKPASPVAASTPPHRVSQADLDRFDKEEEIITGDDVARKIASLEFSGTTDPAKVPVSKEKGISKDAPASPPPPVLKSTPPSPGKKSSAAGLAAVGTKPKGHDDSITGDDVADKIDAFFGLFDEKK